MQILERNFMTTEKCHLNSRFEQCCCDCTHRLDLMDFASSIQDGYVCIVFFHVGNERIAYSNKEKHSAGCELYDKITVE